MQRLSRFAERMAHSQVISPVIIKTEPRRLRDTFEFLRPYFEDVRELRPRIFAPTMVPLSPFPFKVIQRFSMIASILPREVIFKLAENRNIKQIYYDKPFRAFDYPTVPNEGMFEAPHRILKKIEFTTTYWTKRLLGCHIANQKGYKGRNILVGVVDTGTSRVHEQTRRVLFKTTMKQFRDENGHGTHVASTIGGTYASDDYLSSRAKARVNCEGMAPECGLLAVKCLGFFQGIGSTSNIIEAFDICIADKVNVLNLSAGSDVEGETAEEDIFWDVLNSAIQNGVIPICAAGNAGPKKGTICSPGVMPQVLTVGAFDPMSGKLADFSSRGPTPWDDIKPDVVAPGVSIDSGIVGVSDKAGDGVPSRYSPLSGTCLSGDTNILLNPKVKKITNVNEKDHVITLKDGKLTKEKVMRFYPNGLNTVHLLRTEEKEIKATKEHKFLKYMESEQKIKWIPLSELKIGDEILCVKKTRSEKLLKHLKELNSKQKGKNNPFYGKTHKPETIEKIRSAGLGRIPWNKGLTNEDERVWKITKGNPGFGTYERTPLQKEQLRTLRVGKEPFNKGKSWIEWMSEEGVKVCEETQFKEGDPAWNKGVPWEEWMPKEAIEKIMEWGKSEEARLLLLKNSKKVNKMRKDDPEFATKIIRNWQTAIHQKPNRAEKWLGRLIEKVCPNTYTYNKGEFILAGKIPDFFDKEGRKVIEMFGEPFHTEEEAKERIKLFKSVGYDTLIIWYLELRSRQGEVMQKMKLFTAGIDNEELRLERIREIKYAGIEKVYDIGVRDSHNFVANGIVVHNSMATPHVTGLVALMAEAKQRALGQRLTVSEIKEMLNTYSSGKTNDDGYGTINWEMFTSWMDTEYGKQI